MKFASIIRWTPRILSIVLILLLLVLSFDVFESNQRWTMIVLGFLIHNIPTIVLLVTLVISWRHPWVGSIVFMTAGIFYAIMMFFNEGLDAILAVVSLSLPGILIGILFGLDHHRSKKHKKSILNVMV